LFGDATWATAEAVVRVSGPTSMATPIGVDDLKALTANA